MATCRTVSAQEATGRVHAVIISGGMNKLMNHERYWNDCAFLYRTLREEYRFQPQDITLLISDGGEAGRDMLLADGSGFATSPNDLDGDGGRDVWLPATLAQVEATLAELATRLTAADRLFLFVVDHGAYDDGLRQSYAYLWGGGRLYDVRLAQLLDQFRVASMSIVMGLCRSGGFIDDLRRENRVIATSCADGEESWACRDKPYDEFVYHWTCAVARHDPEGNAIHADNDGDGSVSMAEAFDYARLHDRREETPQYSSTPSALAGQWFLSQKHGNGIKTIDNGQPAIGNDAYDLLGRLVNVSADAGAKKGVLLKVPDAKYPNRPVPVIVVKKK